MSAGSAARRRDAQDGQEELGADAEFEGAEDESDGGVAAGPPDAGALVALTGGPAAGAGAEALENAPPQRVRPIVLAAGEQARFVLASTDVVPSPGCRAPYTGKTLEVFPPNQNTAIRKPFRGSFCDLVVAPLHAVPQSTTVTTATI